MKSTRSSSRSIRLGRAAADPAAIGATLHGMRNRRGGLPDFLLDVGSATANARAPWCSELRPRQHAGRVTHGRKRAIAVHTIAKATSPGSADVEPVSSPKNTAIANVDLKLPPCRRSQFLRAQRYSARVR